MSNPVQERIQKLREMMRKQKVDAFIIPSNDPHMSEYVAPHWQAREWFSDFTGSAGTLVVTQKEAGLWTDSRYFLQAARQLEGSGIDLYKMGLPDTPDIKTFLKNHLPDGARIGYEPSVTPYRRIHDYKEGSGSFEDCRLSLQPVCQPYQEIWPERPLMPEGKAFVHPLEYAGQSCADKVAALRRHISEAGGDALLLTALDEIAWTLNIRGNDVHCNPVVISYLLITREEAYLFIDPRKTDEEMTAYLQGNGVETHPYGDFFDFLTKNNIGTILADYDQTNAQVGDFVGRNVLIDAPSPVALLKSVRNEVEISGLHRAMQRDGVALVKFLKWLEKAVPQGRETEISVDQKLHAYRAAQPLYMGESFDTIAGYREHGAIVHYEATPETDAALRPEGFLLLDSGAQYLDGTTDITRTIALGPLTQEEKEDYTLILKGHIALATAVFPEGTRGAQLDVLARMPIWQHRMNYLHGTGHGVGHFLNVHEGPQSIRMNENPVALKAGMLTSNEPGVYKAGSHGIRTENLMLTVPAGEGMFGNYLKFETVTLCPIDTTGLIREMLTDDEIRWLNEYHRTVCEKLSPDLDEEERAWLKEKCKAITNH